MDGLSGYNKCKLLFAGVMMIMYGTWFGTFWGGMNVWAVVFVMMLILSAIYLFIKGWRYGYVVLATCIAGGGILYGIDAESMWIVCANVAVILGCSVFLALDGYRTDVCVGKQNNVLMSVSMAIVGLISLLIFMIILMGGLCGLFSGSSAEDLEWKYYKECIENRTNMGYPVDQVEEFCEKVSWGCSDKVYVPDCNTELHCCLDDVELHKKWNYLHK